MTIMQQTSVAPPPLPGPPALLSKDAAQLKRTIMETQRAVEEAAREGAAARPALAQGGAGGAGGGGGGGGGGAPVILVDPRIGSHAGNNGNNDVPPQVVDISIAFFIMCGVMVIGWPIARAFGKRLERRADVPAVSAGLTDQLQRIEQAVDAMSIEIERISESQRFMAKLQNAQAAQPISLPADRR